MNRLAFAAALALLASNPCAAADSPTAPIDAFLAAFNKGDIAAIAATQNGSDLVIIDEVPPHMWQGPRAVKAWLASLGAYDKARGRSDGAVTCSKPQVLNVAGDRGYAVVPAVYSFKEKGKPMREVATMTFALRHGAGGWKIAGWTWNGMVPSAGK